MVYLVIVFSVLLLMLLLRLYIRRFIPIVLLTGLVVGVAYFVFSQSQVVTTKDLYPELYNPEYDIQEVTIQVNDPREFRTVVVKEMSTEDKEQIHELLQDFSDVKVRLDDERGIRKYSLKFSLEKPTQTGSNFEYVNVNIGEDFVSSNPILNDTDHLEALRALEEDDALSWTIVEEGG
ncbi:hypothetical protein [Halobacillus salinus]|uniref:Uncharacterized protein n=1 Tax=Halobacillus salinus TaxID=192814 RepID=A0A4Z0H7F5_9BACI|nr:hypothetical protein [Halobacillus salinus]TGB04915.1 hypothetical protein E4663_07955 [Halobacillus salinus]